MSGIVSLLPAATEIVLALDLDERLVAVTDECDVGAGGPRRIVTRAVATAGLSPAEIDEQVARAAAVGSGPAIAPGALAGLDPELVLAQDLCAVCAVPSGDVEAALARLGCDAEVVTLDPRSVGDIVAGIAEVAAHAGVSDRGDALVADMRCRLADVAVATASRPRPRMAVVEWVDPLYLGGHWIPDMVELAGGTSVAGYAGERSRPSTWDALRAARPDAVVVAPCGFGLEDASAQARAVAEQLPDVPVWAIDADGLVVRPGPRVVDGVEALASILHPEVVAAHPSVRRVA
ncbi:iron complex transport system substrate-binding protein [Mumia flava]|uniref:Iron complex transport system substrate-binding protein n=1 Tax=Mumia flava TaxID=1348852 RepID=A0A0B2B2X3_9ACTN|nr:ABC transporter substrate-binding protein [Mumia flava]PJJ57829.1 iron complex transport system substrate-binding protein [Mumia flava]